jgi:hypothetical protein
MHTPASCCMLCNALAPHTLSHLSIVMVCNQELNTMDLLVGVYCQVVLVQAQPVCGQVDSFFQLMLLAHMSTELGSVLHA